MLVKSLVRIFIWACFAVGTLQATNAVPRHDEVGAQLASHWHEKDARFLSPLRVQVVPSSQSFIKSDAGSKRSSSAILSDTALSTQQSQILCASRFSTVLWAWCVPSRTIIEWSARAAFRLS